MNFFEGLGMFTVALVVFIIVSLLIGAIFTIDLSDELVFVGAWISGSVIYALTVVGMIYISRYGGSL